MSTRSVFGQINNEKNEFEVQYSVSWCLKLLKVFQEKHCRATEILHKIYKIPRDFPAKKIMCFKKNWERWHKYKYLIIWMSWQLNSEEQVEEKDQEMLKRSLQSIAEHYDHDGRYQSFSAMRKETPGKGLLNKCLVLTERKISIK